MRRSDSPRSVHQRPASVLAGSPGRQAGQSSGGPLRARPNPEHRSLRWNSVGRKARRARVGLRTAESGLILGRGGGSLIDGRDRCRAAHEDRLPSSAVRHARGRAVRAGGCGASVQPIDVMPGCPDMPLRGPAEFAAAAPPENMIDDFEDGEVPALPMIGGRNGAWITTPQLPPPGSDGFRRNINQVRRERHALGAPHLRGCSPLRCQLDRQHAGPVRFGDALQRQRVQRLLVLDREGRNRDAPVRNADRREHDRYRQQRHVYALRRLLRDPQAHPADPHLDPLVRPVQRSGAIRLRRPAGSARQGQAGEPDHLARAPAGRHLDRRHPLRTLARAVHHDTSARTSPARNGRPHTAASLPANFTVTADGTTPATARAPKRSQLFTAKPPSART